MDIGHGAGSFSFETAEALMSEGYKPDVISIHWTIINGRELHAAADDGLRAPWIEQTEAQQKLVELGHTSSAFTPNTGCGC